MTGFISCKFLFSFNSGTQFRHSIFQFILRFKMEIVECGSKAYFTFFPYSQKENRKFAFVNVALVGLPNFFKFMKQMKYLLLNVSLGCTFKFLSIHYRIGKLEFLNSAYFHICQIVRLLFQAWHVSRRGRANLWLKNCQCSRKEMFIFMQQICVSLSAGNTVSKLKWE